MKQQYNFSETQDWAQFFQKIFDVTQINHVLEFGLGLGTRFLCDNSASVTSVELAVSDLNKNWTEETQQSLKDYQNWTLHYSEMPTEIIKSNNDAISNKYPLSDLSYLPILEKIISPFIDKQKWDLIFVDAGIHNRGDIVNLCFDKADIIAAHDTDRTGRVIPNIYGYNIVNIPDNYVEIHLNSTYCGTTFWLNKHSDDMNIISAALQK
jgi:hypothetical protein